MIARPVAAARALGLALLAACGTDVVPPQRALDAAPTVDAAVPMRVRVLSLGGERPVGAPAAGVRVGFLPPTGAALVITTGDDGLAVADMPSGTAIVVAQSRGFGLANSTIVLDVAAGATLTLGDRARPQVVGNGLGVRRATAAPWDGVIELSASCSSGSGGQVEPEVAWFQLDCARAGDATVVARAFGDDGLQAYAALDHVDLRVDAPLALPPWQPTVDARLVFTNLPLELGSVTAQRTARDQLDDWSSVIASAPIEGASVVVPLRAVPVGDHTVTAVTLFDDGVPAYRAQLVRPLAERTTVLDVGGDAPARIEGATLTAAERRLSWAYQRGGRRPDLVRATISSSLDGFGRVQEILVSGERTSLVLPPFPPELADVDLGDAGTAFVVEIGAVELPEVAAFAEAASLLDLWTPSHSSLGTGLDRAPFDWWITGS